MLFNHLAYLILYPVNGFFGVTALSGCFNILNTFLSLIQHERKVFYKALFAGRFLINIWYFISCLSNINSALAIQKVFLKDDLFIHVMLLLIYIS